MLDLESGLGSIPTGGNILSLDFFHVVKPLMPILPLLPILSICEKPVCIPINMQVFFHYLNLNMLANVKLDASSKMHYISRLQTLLVFSILNISQIKQSW